MSFTVIPFKSIRKFRVLNTYVANNGMEFSNFIKNNSTNYIQTYNNSNRRWTAFFESTGIKRMGTAVPSVTNS